MAKGKPPNVASVFQPINLSHHQSAVEVADVHSQNLLAGRWPEAYRGTLKHLAASVACADFCDGGTDSSIAREAFLKAAQEAGLAD
jgi:hypothetical protein